MKKTIQTDDAAQAIGPYTQGQVFNGMIFTSGQVPLSKEGTGPIGDIKLQTRLALQNLQAVLKEGGGDLDTVIKTTCFLQSMDEFTAFNEVYAEFFANSKPARSTVEVAKLPRGCLVEVEAIAYQK